MYTTSGFRIRYTKHGGGWVVWDMDNMIQVTKIERVGVHLHRKDGVLGHGSDCIGFRKAANLCTSSLPNTFRYIVFTPHDSEELLNQLISDKLAASLLFHRDDLQDIIMGSRN